MDNETIEKEAEAYADSIDRRGCAFWRGLKMGYIAKATAEHSRIVELTGQDLIKIFHEQVDRIRKEKDEGIAELLEALEAYVKDTENHPSFAAREHYKPFIDKAKAAIEKVGNEELVKTTMPYGYSLMKEKGNICEWLGGYETKETYDKRIVTAGGVYKSNLKNVAILTLPEEKKNTMENMTKEQAIDERRAIALKKISDVLSELTSSGSVAAPKPDTLEQAQIDYYENKLEGMFRNQADQEKELASLRQQLADMKEVVKDLLPLAQEVFDSITIDDGESHKEYVSLKSLLSRAKALLDKQ